MTDDRTAMPASVRVGAYRYQILTDAAEIKRVSDSQDLPDDSEWAAFSDHDHLIIGLNPDHHDDANRLSLLHELIHCCLRVSGVWPNTYAEVVAEARGRHQGVTVEEHTVSGIANPLLGVLRDNPDLTAWLA